MKGIERRVASLEERRRARDDSFSHLSDDDLEAAGLDLIEQLGAAGADLPDDWRELYHEDLLGLVTALTDVPPVEER